VNVGQTLLAIHLKELQLEFREQYQFHHRKWRLDFYLPEHRIGIEVDGYFAGKHGAGYGADNEKQNTATMCGIRMLRFSTNDVKRGKAKEFLQDWL
jgi:very-short-patch-repair endonuclease